MANKIFKKFKQLVAKLRISPSNVASSTSLPESVLFGNSTSDSVPVELVTEFLNTFHIETEAEFAKTAEDNKQLRHQLLDFQKKFDRELSEHKQKFEAKLLDIKKEFEAELLDQKVKFEALLHEQRRKFEVELLDQQRKFEKRIEDQEKLSSQKVVLENAKIEQGRMVGTIMVANIAFEKIVFIRFIRFIGNRWKTWDEPAQYHSSPFKTYDIFHFNIDRTKREFSTEILCLLPGQKRRWLARILEHNLQS